MMHGPRLALRPRLVLQMSMPGFLFVLPPVAWADDEIRPTALVTATGGWSSNPFTESGSSRGSAYVQVDARPTVSLVAEHSAFTLNGALNYKHYFEHYADSNDYGAGLDYAGTPSSRLTTHAVVRFDSSIIGGLEALNPAASPTQPVPPPTTGPDLALVGTRDRRSLLSFLGDMGYVLSAYDSLTVGAHYTRTRYGGSTRASAYDNYGGDLGYSRRVSEHLQLGVQGSAARYTYQDLLGKSQVYSLQATIKDNFSDTWNLTGAVGVSVSRQTPGGRGTYPTGNLQLCRVSERASLCVIASETVLPTGGIGTVNTKSVSANYSYKLTELSNFSLSGQYSQNGHPLNMHSPNQIDFANKYVTFSGIYDRTLSRRISFVATTIFRKIMGDQSRSPSDFGGTLGISVRFGDIQ